MKHLLSQCKVTPSGRKVNVSFYFINNTMNEFKLIRN